ncbi:iron complex transport system permease protein [Thermotomaculum hydrothermale]|uniref:Iron complex transport system permease protein n=1 Tax=Thermotomaculum hydrothermale TaxID=981385 RepID=A0A7R6SZ55_9BACT|nr:iron ABC transporter permease [Thermotomaculum hydrothermale]BBB32402.1 iron complex transport system permease protein [Thermotomaculum hydrothermale]
MFMRNALNFVALILLIFVLFIAVILYFPERLNYPFSDTDLFILKSIRFPMFIVAFLVGGSLSISGLVFQTVFDNPLATPYTLGVASGASLGVVIYTVFLAKVIHIPLIFFSLLGGLLSVFVIFLIAKVVNYYSSQTILLSGVALNFFFGSLILFFQYFANRFDTFEIYRWLLGGIKPEKPSLLLLLAIVSLIVLVLLMLLSRKLDLFLLGDTIAKTKGLDTEKYRLIFITLVSVLTAFCVSIAGPIAFVGIIVPHIVVRLFDGLHRERLLFSFLLGGVSLVLCQALSVKILYPSILPIGVLTAIIGTPIFIYILILRNK